MVDARGPAEYNIIIYLNFREALEELKERQRVQVAEHRDFFHPAPPWHHQHTLLAVPVTTTKRHDRQLGHKHLSWMPVAYVWGIQAEYSILNCAKAWDQMADSKPLFDVMSYRVS